MVWRIASLRSPFISTILPALYRSSHNGLFDYSGDSEWKSYLDVLVFCFQLESDTMKIGDFDTWIHLKIFAEL